MVYAVLFAIPHAVFVGARSSRKWQAWGWAIGWVISAVLLLLGAFTVLKIMRHSEDTQNASLLAKVTIDFGISEERGHRVYYANVDIGGMGLTGPMGTSPVPRGQRSRIWGFYMEAQYQKYDVSTPGDATQIAFREIAKGVVNGWTCR
jgi:hypothetical protein